ncbi:hypothetical protein CRM22_003478 [Opisthorchis felineus]|uniref:Uncharacterized protein n=1 Tax=Opisthorchis felineus TaxID=147828 RepID=A0A4S2M127_OPIFE|nr:hypothetical protein CRM22_003478 [Opisthorchis felineus]
MYAIFIAFCVIAQPFAFHGNSPMALTTGDCYDTCLKEAAACMGGCGIDLLICGTGCAFKKDACEIKC